MRLLSLPELLGIPKEEGIAGRRSVVHVTGQGGDHKWVISHCDLEDTRTVVAASRGCSLRVGAQPLLRSPLTASRLCGDSSTDALQPGCHLRHIYVTLLLAPAVFRPSTIGGKMFRSA